ncbi:MAG: hypothetical protein AAGE52_05590 [Myxococcota bacterium]
MRKILTLTFALAIGCGGGLVAVGPARGAMISQTDDLAAIQDAIARALQDRRFAVESQDAGRVVARFDHRGISIRVMIEYTASEYRITYVDSSGLDYRVDPRTQEPMISPHYGRHVSRLDRTIQDELRRPAREQEQAIEDEREHQLALQQQETDRQVALQESQQRASRRERRAQRREARRQRWAEMERDRQATERERLRAETARAEADAEYLRRQPPPTIQNYGAAPVQVDRFAFQAAEHQTDSISLSMGFMPDPFAMNGRARGRLSSANLGMPRGCPGFWSNQPQHYVSLPEGMNYFRIDVVANEDTTLAVVTPDGQVWCNDDGGGGHNPRLAGRFPAGVYAVYVGTYQRGRRSSYTMQLSERQPRAQAPRVRPRAEQRQQRQQVPDCRQILLRRGHHASNLRHCENAEPHCAQTLLERGHHPTNLRHCQGVDAQCAVTLLQTGQHPTHLRHCR